MVLYMYRHAYARADAGRRLSARRASPASCRSLPAPGLTSQPPGRLIALHALATADHALDDTHGELVLVPRLVFAFILLLAELLPLDGLAEHFHQDAHEEVEPPDVQPLQRVHQYVAVHEVEANVARVRILPRRAS